MKTFIFLACLASSVFAAKMPIEPTTVSVTEVVDNVKITTPMPVMPAHHEHHNTMDVVVPNHVTHVPSQHIPHEHVQQIPPVPYHVQQIVQQVHQHIPQVISHHVKEQASSHVNVPHVGDKVTVLKPVHHVHVAVTHQNVDGHKHVAHNVPSVVAGVTPVVGGVHQHNVVPQTVADEVHKVEQHIQQLMHQVEQHIPQVINHQIAQKQKQKEQSVGVSVDVDQQHTTTQHPHVGVVGDEVITPVVVNQHQPHVDGVVVPLPEVTVKTTTM